LVFEGHSVQPLLRSLNPQPCIRFSVRLVSFLGFAGVSLLCQNAAADPKAHAEVAAAGGHRHDGFYMRFATGFGAYDERADSETTEVYSGRLRTRARGFAVASEFAIGGTPYEGLV